MKVVEIYLCDCNQCIDKVEVPADYTERDYIMDCESNGCDVESFYSDYYEDGLNIEFREV